MTAGHGLACPLSYGRRSVGELQAHADRNPEERFDATERRTYDGRALAVLRPNGAQRRVPTVATFRSG